MNKIVLVWLCSLLLISCGNNEKLELSWTWTEEKKYQLNESNKELIQDELVSEAHKNWQLLEDEITNLHLELNEELEWIWWKYLEEINSINNNSKKILSSKLEWITDDNEINKIVNSHEIDIKNKLINLEERNWLLESNLFDKYQKKELLIEKKYAKLFNNFKNTIIEIEN